MPKFVFSLLLASSLLCSAVVAQISSTTTPTTANDIQIDFTNAGNSSFTLTQFFFAFQNGGFDFFDVGQPASFAVESIAEDGLFGNLQTDFDFSGQPANRQGIIDAPGGFSFLVEPGETATAFLVPINPSLYQFFTFAAMLLPTNDTFIGNDSPTAHQVFDSAGNINDPSGTFTINIFTEDLYDAGTEENTGFGTPFSLAGGTDIETVGGVIGPAGDLEEFLNVGTPAGGTITDFFEEGELVATIEISIVPEPGMGAILLSGLCVLPLLRRGSRRRRR